MQAVVTVMPALLSTLNALLPYWIHVKDETHPLHSIIVKGILKLVKTAIEVQSTHPWSCRHAQVRSLQFNRGSNRLLTIQ